MLLKKLSVKLHKQETSDNYFVLTLSSIFMIEPSRNNDQKHTIN